MEKKDEVQVSAEFATSWKRALNAARKTVGKKRLDEHPECKAVYPIHMNPVVRKAADEELGGCDRIHIIEPIEVFDCHNFEARCHLCLTDSGGIQEEVPRP